MAGVVERRTRGLSRHKDREMGKAEKRAAQDVCVCRRIEVVEVWMDGLIMCTSAGSERGSANGEVR